MAIYENYVSSFNFYEAQVVYTWGPMVHMEFGQGTICHTLEIFQG